MASGIRVVGRFAQRHTSAPGSFNSGLGNIRHASSPSLAVTDVCRAPFPRSAIGHDLHRDDLPPYDTVVAVSRDPDSSLRGRLWVVNPTRSILTLACSQGQKDCHPHHHTVLAQRPSRREHLLLFASPCDTLETRRRSCPLLVAPDATPSHPRMGMVIRPSNARVLAPPIGTVCASSSRTYKEPTSQT